MHIVLTAALAALAVAAPRTFRADYFHTGNAKEERFSLDRVVVEPLPWPGNPARPIDDTNLGRYLFEVRDVASGALLYSRGFASIYGEWETTPEAKEVNRTFSESVRFPEPPGPVDLHLKKRDAKNAFALAWSVRIDPKDIFVDPSPPPSGGKILKLLESGPSAQKVDLLFLGDGYTAAERGKCEKDMRRSMGVLFGYAPYKQRKSDFNVWGLCPASAESGISRPSTGVHKRTPLGATYDAFRSERYILTFENRALREIASNAPYEFLVILTNTKTYGGGGIFNLYSTAAADSFWAPYLVVHEFGHHFAGLGDEYYTSDTAYEPSPERVEPWEPNLTALLDPGALKWKQLVESGTPVPTSWKKADFEQAEKVFLERRRKIRAEDRPESEMDALFLEQRVAETKLFADEPWRKAIGAFEGAMYEARGYYRPQIDCVMFSRNDVPFCGVCSHAVERIVDLYSAGPPEKD